MDLDGKYERLKSILRGYGHAAIAFSGGVDSSFLAKVAFDELGENAIAITLASPMTPKSEIRSAEEFALTLGIRHIILRDANIEDKVADNPSDRCYHCKKVEFGGILAEARKHGIEILLEGSNADDVNDYRPGLQAVAELPGVESPLRAAELAKADIRELSKRLGLPTWNKPAMACLASRIPYGEKITVEKLSRVEKAEDWLRARGFVQFRVRSHGDIARIEVAPSERAKWFDERLMDEASEAFRAFGFLYAALELSGYRMGSLNRALSGLEEAR
jgi:uncharacterized protein